MKTKIKMLCSEDVWHPRHGGQLGNQNALKSGRYTAEKQAIRRRIAGLIRRANAAIAMVDASLRARRRAPQGVLE